MTLVSTGAHHSCAVLPSSRYSVCSTDWLRDFVDNKMLIPHESMFVMVRAAPAVSSPPFAFFCTPRRAWGDTLLCYVHLQVLLVHVMLLALSASTDSKILRYLLYTLNIVHGIDVFARVLAEGTHDFWYGTGMVERGASVHIIDAVCTLRTPFQVVQPPAEDP